MTIDIPIRIDPKVLSVIRKSFRIARREVGPEETGYVESKIETVVHRLKNREGKWVQRLGIVSQALWRLRCEGASGASIVTKKSISAIDAALLYLCNPYDIIPDFTPGIGYCDDAVVVNFCLKILSSQELALVREFVKEVAD